MAQDKIADKEQRLAEAWARWREADFSWEGLLDPRKEPEGFDSLQHYWRTDPETGEVRDDAALVAAGELIVVAGQKTYHLAHLPLHYEDGTPTAKTTSETASVIHNHLIALIEVRLKAALIDKAPSALLQGLVTGDTLNLSKDRFDHVLRIIFDKAIIASADFESATFSRYAGFKWVTFSGKASFWDTNFSGYADFWGTTFLDIADFWIVKFSGYADFSAATFLSYSRFSSAAFSYSAAYDRVNFSGDTDFSDVAFSGYARFDNVLFSSDANFSRTAISGRAIFNYAKFSGNARFDYAKFLGDITCNCARFTKGMNFINIIWSPNHRGHHKAFFNTTFDGLADFSGSGFHAFAAFDGAQFKQGLRFDKIDRNDASGWRRFESQARHHFDYELATCKEAHDRFDQEQRLEELENGCRLLKQEMIKLGDKSREQILYKFELLARRAQKSTALSEKALSYLYGWFSDYGGSALRPLVWLVGIWLGFSLLFLTFLFSVSPPRPAPAPAPAAVVAQASPSGACKDAMRLPAKASDLLPLSLSVSASRIFPFGAFEDVSKRLVSAYDCEGYTGRALGFRLLATVESFLALTLAFLFGLAVRRRFQIS